MMVVILEPVDTEIGLWYAFFNEECGNLLSLVALKLDNLAELFVVD